MIGTALLYSFFGKKCIEYTLERAIAEDKLTPYKYHPVVIHLSEDELMAYEQVSYEMSKCLIKDKNGKYKLNKHGEILALRRARIVAGASEKLNALREQIIPFIHDNNILVYCGATNVIDPNSDDSSYDEGDIRQIEAVTRILGNECQMCVAQFTSKENMETRASIKEVIDSIRGYIFSVFESFVNHTTVIREYLSENSEEKAKKFRNSEGGNLLFRPIAFTEYFEAAFWLQDRGGDTTYDDAFISLNTVDLDIGKAPWLGLVWDGSKIISKASKTTIRYLLVFLADSTVMTEKDIQKLVRDYASGTNRSEAESALALGRESL